MDALTGGGSRDPLKHPKPASAVEVAWYYRGGDIARGGPCATQEEAASRLIALDGNPIDGAYVWPERRAALNPDGDVKR